MSESAINDQLKCEIVGTNIADQLNESNLSSELILFLIATLMEGVISALVDKDLPPIISTKFHRDCSLLIEKYVKELDGNNNDNT